MSTLPKELLTPEQYLTIEREAEFKSEYFDGEMFMMAGASPRHNIIVSNIIRSLGTQLLNRDCIVYPSDQRVKIEALSKYTYPDVTVACSKRLYEGEQKDILLNPNVIFEILSESTEAYDRGKKFEHYRQIDSLVEYMLVAQDTAHVEQYIRQNDSTWTYREYHQKEDVVKLVSVECSLALGDVYHKVFT